MSDLSLILLGFYAGGVVVMGAVLLNADSQADDGETWYWREFLFATVFWPLTIILPIIYKD